MIALADVDSGRLLHTLSLHGPTTADRLATLLALAPDRITDLLADADALGVVQLGPEGCYRVEPAALAAVVQQNRDHLLGAAA